MNAAEIVEVSPRDGLQNEANILSAADKLELIRRLAECGLRRIEATACVSAKRVPQMADAEEVLGGLPALHANGAAFSALAANMRGLETILKCGGASEVSVFTAASETFAQNNIGCGIQDSLQRFAPMLQLAKQRGLKTRGYVSCAVVCPYEGVIAPEQTAEVAAQLAQAGCDEISLGDTVGEATPKTTRAMLRSVCRSTTVRLAAHFHDTFGFALANIGVALEEGVHIVDASVGGLGGCPFAPGAAGNAATEDVVAFLQREGFSTGVNLDMLADSGQWICRKLNRSYFARSGLAQLARRKS